MIIEWNTIPKAGDIITVYYNPKNIDEVISENIYKEKVLQFNPRK